MQWHLGQAPQHYHFHFQMGIQIQLLVGFLPHPLVGSLSHLQVGFLGRFQWEIPQVDFQSHCQNFEPWDKEKAQLQMEVS